MATPRQAAAAAAAAISSGTSSSARGEDESRPLGARRDKKKVDWGDVEAKAKREAMRLLEWRKQLAAQAATQPRQQPLKKRRRKVPSPTKRDSSAGVDAKADAGAAEQPRQERDGKTDNAAGDATAAAALSTTPDEAALHPKPPPEELSAAQEPVCGSAGGGQVGGATARQASVPMEVTVPPEPEETAPAGGAAAAAATECVPAAQPTAGFPREKPEVVSPEVVSPGVVSPGVVSLEMVSPGPVAAEPAAQEVAVVTPPAAGFPSLQLDVPEVSETARSSVGEPMAMEVAPAVEVVAPAATAVAPPIEAIAPEVAAPCAPAPAAAVAPAVEAIAPEVAAPFAPAPTAAAAPSVEAIAPEVAAPCTPAPTLDARLWPPQPPVKKVEDAAAAAASNATAVAAPSVLRKPQLPSPRLGGGGGGGSGGGGSRGSRRANGVAPAFSVVEPDGVSSLPPWPAALRHPIGGKKEEPAPASMPEASASASEASVAPALPATVLPPSAGGIARFADAKGMFLLASVAASRALEEEARGSRRQGGVGLPSPSSRGAKTPSGDRGCSLAPVRSPGGGLQARNGLDAAASLWASAAMVDGKTAESGASAWRHPAPKEEPIPPSGVRERGSPLPWRPQELRFIVSRGGQDPASNFGSGNVSPSATVAASGGGSGGSGGGYLEGRGKSGPEAWWERERPKMPGFSIATGRGGTAVSGDGGWIGGAAGGRGVEQPRGSADFQADPVRRAAGLAYRGGGGGGGSGSDDGAYFPRESGDRVSSLEGYYTSGGDSPSLSGSTVSVGVGGGGGSSVDYGLGQFRAADHAHRDASFGHRLAAAPAPAAASGGQEWGQGRYSLRWLPAEGLSALQAAGASCGMDRASLDAAALAAEAAAEDSAAAVAAAQALAEASAGAGGGPVMWGYDGYYDGGATVQARPRAKRKRRRKRETHVLVSESDGEEGPSTTTSVWAGLEEAAKAEAKALLSYRNSGMVEAEADCNQHWVRRSVRAAGASAVDCPHVVKLLEQIRSNDPEVEVLKLHHYLGPDVNTVVIDAVLDALLGNDNCQALYIQNFNEGFRDEQVAALVKVLRKGNIWCLNAGENYKVTLPTWWQFVEDIKGTNVTHAYLSEHVITPELKNAMRTAIRDNRVKHTRHKTASNLEVIRRCTNMWWNPINSKDLQAELKMHDGASYGDVQGDTMLSYAPERVPCSLHLQAKQQALEDRQHAPSSDLCGPPEKRQCIFQPA